MLRTTIECTPEFTLWCDLSYFCHAQ
uniref:Uncharacterized protein n=1 Tax=Anguilla anguilla TaxID=7936 RepID=A0A0E9T9X6_ANGAN